MAGGAAVSDENNSTEVRLRFSVLSVVSKELSEELEVLNKESVHLAAGFLSGLKANKFLVGFLKFSTTRGGDLIGILGFVDGFRVTQSVIFILLELD